MNSSQPQGQFSDTKWMKFCLLLFTIISFFIGNLSFAASITSEFQKLELPKQISFGSKSLIESIYFSTDFSKTVMIGRKSSLKDNDLIRTFNVPRWKLTVSSKKDLLLLSRGLSDKELEILMSKLNQRWTARFLEGVILPKTFAQLNLGTEFMAPCKPVPSGAGALTKTNEEMFSKVSVTNAIKNCDFGLEETIDQIIKSVTDTYTNLDFASIKKITEVWDHITYAVTELSKDLVKALAPLAEKAPQIVEGLLCELMKEHTAGLAMSVVLPGGIKRLPFEIARIVDSVKTVVRSPTILKLVESSKFNHDLRLLPSVFKRMTHVVPESMKAVKFTDANLKRHFDSHAKEFPQLATLDAYKARIQEFSTQSNSRIIHHCVPAGRCSKLNLDTGEHLIIAGDGTFVSFYKLHGNNPQALFNHFVDKAVGHNDNIREH